MEEFTLDLSALGLCRPRHSLPLSPGPRSKRTWLTSQQLPAEGTGKDTKMWPLHPSLLPQKACRLELALLCPPMHVVCCLPGEVMAEIYLEKHARFVMYRRA